MKLLTHIARILVGGLFIFSGFVKLVDPIGSQYKFEEYFSEGVLNLEFLIPYALPFAIVLIVVEVVLGVAILIGWKPKLTVWSLLITIVFFTFLTWYSAYYNKVTDCGCFGDAIKLTPWQSFYKDVLLTILILFLLFRIKDIKPLFGGKIPGILTYLSFFASFYIVYHVLVHLPIVDFRPYAIGKNIPAGMEYKGDGEIPPIHDFMLEDSQNDLAEQILKEPKVMLVIMQDFDKTEMSGLTAIKNAALKAKKKGYKVYGVSASYYEDLLVAKEKHNLPFDFLFCDATTLKTMIRANPGIMILKNGTITDKKNYTDADSVEL